jgi:PilZ domain
VQSPSPASSESLKTYLSIYIEQHGKMYLPFNCFLHGITGTLRRTVGGAGGFEDRRIGERYRLALPVQLNEGIGTTCDISTSGIFFETESAYAIGDTIQLFLNFEHETLQCEARVVRVEPRNGQFGVAVELKSYVFC